MQIGEFEVLQWLIAAKANGEDRNAFGASGIGRAAFGAEAIGGARIAARRRLADEPLAVGRDAVGHQHDGGHAAEPLIAEHGSHAIAERVGFAGRLQSADCVAELSNVARLEPRDFGKEVDAQFVTGIERPEQRRIVFQQQRFRLVQSRNAVETGRFDPPRDVGAQGLIVVVVGDFHALGIIDEHNQIGKLRRIQFQHPARDHH